MTSPNVRNSFDERCLDVYGCTRAERLALNDGLHAGHRQSKAYRYWDQRRSAGKRGIAWEITFPEWVAMWNESGKWHLRGVGVGKYCMARNGDSGPYKVGNVRIALCTENTSEIDRSGQRTGKVKGYSRLCRSKDKPFTAYFQRKTLGNFATEAEAHAAYLAAKAAA